MHSRAVATFHLNVALRNQSPHILVFDVFASETLSVEIPQSALQKG